MIGDKDVELSVFFDFNIFFEDGIIVLWGIFFIKDGVLVVYMIIEGGFDWWKVIVLDIEIMEVVGDILIDVKFSGLFWKDKDGFYYSSYDNLKGISELLVKI